MRSSTDLQIAVYYGSPFHDPCYRELNPCHGIRYGNAETIRNFT
jgi:hypothetical protein